MNQFPDVPTLKTKEYKNHSESKNCHLCSEPLGRQSINNETDAVETEVTVINHDHCIGKYCGAAHQVCNLKCHELREILCFVHNLKGCDAHLLMQEMETFLTEKLN